MTLKPTRLSSVCEHGEQERRMPGTTRPAAVKRHVHSHDQRPTASPVSHPTAIGYACHRFATSRPSHCKLPCPLPPAHAPATTSSFPSSPQPGACTRRGPAASLVRHLGWWPWGPHAHPPPSSELGEAPQAGWHAPPPRGALLQSRPRDPARPLSPRFNRPIRCTQPVPMHWRSNPGLFVRCLSSLS